MKQLVDELAKQRAGLKDNVSHLIQESLKPLETAVGALRDTVGSFQANLLATEIIAGENFKRLTSAEATIKAL
ncbi:U1 small nuclear ribonucleoprotein component SNU71 [Dissostichus eleginoides]|nr:U1 small nuclear ribonucleoprotein component SNU71 [Dissostichus eleginoides]